LTHIARLEDVMKKLFRLALLGGIAFAIYKAIEEKKQWMGLTENEARAKLNDRLSARVPQEKLDKVADQIVDQMRQRGVLRTEPATSNGS
jgi:hypothetical protein